MEKKRKHKGIICWMCGGKGKVIFKKLNTETNQICEYEKECPTCGGKGWIKNH